MKKKLLKDFRTSITTMRVGTLILTLFLLLSVPSEVLSQQKSSKNGNSGKIQGTTIYLNKDTTICLDGEEFKVILKISNAEEYYHAAYDLHIDQLTSLRNQIRILEEVMSIDSLQMALMDAAKSGDKALIEKAKSDYDAHNKAFKKISRRLVFWKVVAIVEAGMIVGLTTAVLILVYS